MSRIQPCTVRYSEIASGNSAALLERNTEHVTRLKVLRIEAMVVYRGARLVERVCIPQGLRQIVWAKAASGLNCSARRYCDWPAPNLGSGEVRGLLSEATVLVDLQKHARSRAPHCVCHLARRIPDPDDCERVDRWNRSRSSVAAAEALAANATCWAMRPR